MTSSPQPRARRRAPLPTALLAGAILAAAVPSVASAADQLTLTDTTAPVGPGITLNHQRTLDASGWYDQQILSVDLSNAAVHTDLLAPNKISGGSSTTSSKVNAAGAVAGINGDFSDINGTESPTGAEIKNGRLLKSADVLPWTQLGVGRDGIGRLVDMTVESSATFGGSAHPVLTLNTANFYGSVPADALIAYTSDWGRGLRAPGLQTATDIAEVLVQGDRVVAVNAGGADADPIPDGGFALVGRGASATALRALQVGDDASLAYALKDDVAKDLQFGIGSNRLLVNDGVIQGGLDGDESIAPRTAIGFKDGGRTMLLVTWDGPGGTGRGGVNMRHEAETFASLGAEVAFNMDGGGSTTMVARPLGDSTATVTNVPSDGNERAVPNGVGVFVTPGDGQADQLLLSPSGDAARVFPGLHRTLRVKAVDDHMTPAPLARGDVRWSVNEGSVDGGLLHAPENVFGTLRVRATTDTAQSQTDVRVLGQLHALELSESRLSFAEADAGAARALKVVGRDEEGFTAPVEATDLALDYDDSIVKVTPSGDGLKITPLKAGGTILTVGAGDQQAKLPITIGVQSTTIDTFKTGAMIGGGRWIWAGTNGAGQTVTDTPEGVQVDYGAVRNMGITAVRVPQDQIPLPGKPLRVHVRVKSTQNVSLTYGAFRQPDGTYLNLYSTALVPGWNDVVFTPPASAQFPLLLDTFQAIETNTSLQVAGSIVIGDVTVDVPSDVELPAQEPLRSDALISPDGGLQHGDEDFTFASLSDVQFTSAAPELAKVGIAALKRIRATHPDFVVLNGDITDRGEASDLVLARQTLEQGGCDLVRLGDAVPAPTANTVPCLYVPGNHESYVTAGQGTLDAFRAEFGRAYGTFDHKGTRFILLNSSLGSLAGSDFDQLPMLQEALDSAVSDDSVDNVMIFAHHPVDDPADTKSSQLGDRTEVELVKHMLSGFREQSGKGVSMTGSHAQIMNVHREEGVPYVVLPSSGKAPYGTPDRGGITGWVRWGVDADANAAEDWLKLDVRPFAQSIDLQTPASLEVGASARLGGTLVQPSGVTEGTRVVPLSYPLSLRWSGSAQLAIGAGEDAIDAAREAGKVAILDPQTGELTALKTGTVAVSVEEDSMRDGDDLSPIRTQKTIAVTASTAPGPKAWIAAPVFPDQATSTIGEGQPVTISNTGDEPLEISLDKIVALDGPAGDFIVADDSCKGTTVAPGDTCTLLVRFAPARLDATSTAQLVFRTNTAERRLTLTVSATSTGIPRGDKGDQGAPGTPGEAGPAGPNGQDGTDGSNGVDGRDGAQGEVGAAGPQGDTGATGPAGNDGASGPVGPVGPVGGKGDTGATGARGEQGDKGSPGRDAIVTCTVRSDRVTCKVTFSSRAAKNAKAVKKTAKAALVRNGRTYAKGRVGQLKATRRVTRGRYTLNVGSGKSATKLAVTIR